MANSPRIYCPYSEAACRIADGDLLLFRNGGLIGLWTHSPYRHAATAYWQRHVTHKPGGEREHCSRLVLVDTIEGTGGRSGIPLRREVQERPGKIDVFAVGEQFPEYNARGAVEWLLANLPGKPYGKRTFLHIALSYLPILRIWRRPNFDDLSVLSGHHVCSSARCTADRLGGGVDPVPGLADAFVEPRHLAHSLLYRYRFTLVPDDWEVPA